MSIAEIGDAIPWDEAVDLVEQMGRHPGSHYWSALRGFTEPTSWGDLTVRLQAQTLMNALRARDTEPIKLPMPIPDPETVPDVTPEERDELVAYARATAPFSLDD